MQCSYLTFSMARQGEDWRQCRGTLHGESSAGSVGKLSLGVPAVVVLSLGSAGDMATGGGTRLPSAGPLCAADTGAPRSPPGSPCENWAYRSAILSSHRTLLPSAGPCPADCCGSRNEPATFTCSGHLFSAGQPWWGHAHWTVGMPGFYRFRPSQNQLSATDIWRLKLMLPLANQQRIAMPQEAAATQGSGCSH